MYFSCHGNLLAVNKKLWINSRGIYWPNFPSLLIYVSDRHRYSWNLEFLSRDRSQLILQVSAQRRCVLQFFKSCWFLSTVNWVIGKCWSTELQPILYGEMLLFQWCRLKCKTFNFISLLQKQRYINGKITCTIHNGISNDIYLWITCLARLLRMQN